MFGSIWYVLSLEIWWMVEIKEYVCCKIGGTRKLWVGVCEGTSFNLMLDRGI